MSMSFLYASSMNELRKLPVASIVVHSVLIMMIIDDYIIKLACENSSLSRVKEAAINLPRRVAPCGFELVCSYFYGIFTR